MLARSLGLCQAPAWRRDLATAITRAGDLIEAVGLEPDQSPPLATSARRDFPVLVPRAYAALIERNAPADPLLRQVLPLAAEDEQHPGFLCDPVGDARARRAPGLLQKYSGRALLILTSACPIHCRFCFRRHSSRNLGIGRTDRLAQALAHVANDRSIREVILSGGDPLLLDDEDLARLITDLEAIPHLARLRVHTRMPVVLPSRIDPGLCRLLAGSSLRTIIVIHANHAQELGRDARIALAHLREAGLSLLNQSVLLRGVNDDAERLCELSEALFHEGVLPYYLHLLDPVQGAAHFEVPSAHARRLLAQVRGRLPGYLVPRLVREVSGQPAKVPIA